MVDVAYMCGVAITFCIYAAILAIQFRRSQPPAAVSCVGMTTKSLIPVFRSGDLSILEAIDSTGHVPLMLNAALNSATDCLIAEGRTERLEEILERFPKHRAYFILVIARHAVFMAPTHLEDVLHLIFRYPEYRFPAIYDICATPRGMAVALEYDDDTLRHGEGHWFVKTCLEGYQHNPPTEADMEHLEFIVANVDYQSLAKTDVRQETILHSVVRDVHIRAARAIMERMRPEDIQIRSHQLETAQSIAEAEWGAAYDAAMFRPMTRTKAAR